MGADYHLFLLRNPPYVPWKAHTALLPLCGVLVQLQIIQANMKEHLEELIYGVAQMARSSINENPATTEVLVGVCLLLIKHTLVRFYEPLRDGIGTVLTAALEQSGLQ